MKLKDLMEKYGDYEVTGIFDNDGDKLDGYVNVGLKRSEPKTVWELNNKDEHYAVGDCGFIKHFDYSDFVGYKRDIGNVFLTEEEANREVERRRVETLLLKYGGRRWFKNGKENWFISYDYTEGFFRYVYAIREQRQGMIYFDTEEQLKKAVEEIGEERLKKALFEVR